MDLYNFSLLTPRKQALKIAGLVDRLVAAATGALPLPPGHLASERTKLRRYLEVFLERHPEIAARLPADDVPSDPVRTLRKTAYAVLDAVGLLPADTDYSRLRPDTPSPPRPTLHEVLLDDIRSPFNIGSIIRTAEAFGFRRAVLTGLSATAHPSKLRRASMEAERWIEVLRLPDTGKALRYLEERRLQGWLVTALETLPDAATPAELPPAPRRLLIVGNEEFGIDPCLLQAADETLRIPLRGVKNSLNVAVAFGIAAHAVTTAQPDLPSDSTPT